MELAAQSLIENFIGSLNLFGDKPVRIGDFCRYGEDVGPDYQRIGTVESIGTRSTRIRGGDQALTTIPNADFCKMPIVNYTQRGCLDRGKQLPFPYFTTGYRHKYRDTLDYPPDGSPGASG
ncbi:mechanosensitive ion channel family protein [Microbulbifer celer]|uniref:Small-conductance mechanosensitive channel n=1 Tax=Microbulbifer celer TaxID=435905 RepID=A0ABW3UER6_9GAMM|nr:mechanosensitive ion channel domain-containing protein [Microbulbifer celer]UFN59126.1 mechanosensitive ion channel family protein [Microbulbifer celer]